MDPIANPEVAVTDPIVVGLTIALTWVLSKFPVFKERLRPYLPMFALIIAVLARAILDAIEGEVTLESLLRGLAAGGMAVMSHQQIRQLSKAKIENKQDE